MKIAIIGGGGYIGTALCLYWRKKGHFITATTVSSQKLKKLSSIVQKGKLLDGSNTSEMYVLLKENDLIVLSMSANHRNFEKTFLSTAQSIKNAALQLPTPKRIMYTSNAIVYGDHYGLWVDETSQLSPQTEEAKILVETEKILLSLVDFGWHVNIFRLAEIYGPGRSLTQKLEILQNHIRSGRENFYTNMIHQADIVNAMDYCIHHSLNGIYNLVDDDHPTKKQMFDTLSLSLHLPKITWDAHLEFINYGNRRISNHKIKSVGYNFIHPHRLYE